LCFLVRCCICTCHGPRSITCVMLCLLVRCCTLHMSWTAVHHISCVMLCLLVRCCILNKAMMMYNCQSISKILLKEACRGRRKIAPSKHRFKKQNRRPCAAITSLSASRKDAKRKSDDSGKAFNLKVADSSCWFGAPKSPNMAGTQQTPHSLRAVRQSVVSHATWGS
jgi:hypothetical protein